jgi:hypothetical protein
MDPLQQAMGLLQEAQQTIAMQAEEIQALRQQIKKPAEGMQKKASVKNLSVLTGMREEDLPEFIKQADEREIQDFMTTMEKRARYTAIGKIAEINDGTQADSPAEQLENALANLLG